MAHIALIIGTTMGGAEAVADELQAQLEQAGHQVTATQEPELKELQAIPSWLVVTSTHGAGELPDNLHAFHEALMTQQPDLSPIRIALCGIGDSSYDTFCGALDLLDPLLRSLGAIPLVDEIKIDVQSPEIPEDQALSWLSHWQEQL
ncbi:FMN-binding protein MioC [Ferrimonas balearica]|uniref:FMN-binding protein MioC n=1 Tax=Ferrimonas balearica TaxID=44012 RepID=UPI001C9992B8|nr:FMN-binding protein MioC [Ferrimonas balearica]MBY5923465.1 FMN-binding protein MioC [Ferrimonas balearica]MBY5997844.1 FMN-binding protein MioC [Ferrimonas balearica]